MEKDVILKSAFSGKHVQTVSFDYMILNRNTCSRETFTDYSPICEEYFVQKFDKNVWKKENQNRFSSTRPLLASSLFVFMVKNPIFTSFSRRNIEVMQTFSTFFITELLTTKSMTEKKSNTHFLSAKYTYILTLRMVRTDQDSYTNLTDLKFVSQIMQTIV